MFKGGLRTAAALGATLLLAALLTPTPALAAVTCHGHVATKVGTPGKDQIRGTSGTDVIAGLGGGDLIGGFGSGDIICGGPGSDYLLGGGGDDTLYGDGGNDVVAGGPGNDTLNGGAGPRDAAGYADSRSPITASVADRRGTGEGTDSFSGIEDIVGSQHADDLSGSGRTNFLIGGRGTDRLSAGGGSDLVMGQKGADHLDGGPGQDTASYYFDQGAKANLTTGTGSGGDRLKGLEVLEGSRIYEDDLTGNKKHNVFLGHGGADVIHGRGGGDLIDERDDDGSTDNHLFGDGGKDVIAGAPASFMRGNDGNDVLYANGSTAEGGAGSDRLIGSKFAETLAGGPGSDGLVGRGDPDQLSGGAGKDFLLGGRGPDTLYVDDGNDLYLPGGGDDEIGADDGFKGDPGKDALSYADSKGPVAAHLDSGTVHEPAGHDTIESTVAIYIGSPGKDDVTGSALPERILGMGGNDTLTGGAGDDRLEGGGGNDTISGSENNDTGLGGGGDDSLAGDDGDDILTGGHGTDSANGGLGIDICHAEQQDPSCENLPVMAGRKIFRGFPLQKGAMDMPAALDALQLSWAEVVEMDAGSGNERWYGARDQHLTWSRQL
jgi:Ca2+-binding RTX toxin-like protein